MYIFWEHKTADKTPDQRNQTIRVLKNWKPAQIEFDAHKLQMYVTWVDIDKKVSTIGLKLQMSPANFQKKNTF